MHLPDQRKWSCSHRNTSLFRNQMTLSPCLARKGKHAHSASCVKIPPWISTFPAAWFFLLWHIQSLSLCKWNRCSISGVANVCIQNTLYLSVFNEGFRDVSLKANMRVKHILSKELFFVLPTKFSSTFFLKVRFCLVPFDGASSSKNRGGYIGVMHEVWWLTAVTLFTTKLCLSFVSSVLFFILHYTRQQRCQL